MDIQDFIKDALVQIVNGVSEANSTLEQKGAYVPSVNVAGSGAFWSARPDIGQGYLKTFLKVDFDLGIEVNEGNSVDVNGGAGTKGATLRIAKWVEMDFNAEANAGGKYEHQKSEQNTHRIKFSIPLALPTLPSEEAAATKKKKK